MAQKLRELHGVCRRSSAPIVAKQFETAVDLSAGAFSYVEDCQVCCQPIELASEVDAAGALVEVVASRAVDRPDGGLLHRVVRIRGKVAS